jgi:hypothetical protein
MKISLFSILFIFGMQIIVARAAESTFDSIVPVLNKPFVVKELRPSAYTAPYSFLHSNTDFKRLGISTGLTLAYCVATMSAMMFVVPPETTLWDRSQANPYSWSKNWPVNVFEKGPERDSDFFLVNATHAYAGAFYYMAARGAGLNAPYSFLYSIFFSTFVWEMGLEAMMEPPSINDLILTPVLGSAIGEGFYLLKRAIVANNYEILGSQVLGFTAAFILDPVNELADYLTGGHYKKQKTVALYLSPTNFSRANFSVVINF